MEAKNANRIVKNQWIIEQTGSFFVRSSPDGRNFFQRRILREKLEGNPIWSNFHQLELQG